MIPDADLERAVRRELHQAAARVQVPLPPGSVGPILQRGRRRTVRRALASGSAVLAVCAVFAWSVFALRGLGRHEVSSAGRPRVEHLSVDRIDIGGPSGQVVLADGLVWVLVMHPNQESVVSIVRIDPATLRTVGAPFVLATPRTPAIGGMAVGDDGVWLSQLTLTGSSWDEKPGVVTRVDPQTGKVVATIEVGRHPGGVVVGGGSVWVANTVDDTVSRIDPATNEVIATIPVGHGPEWLAWGFGTLWVENEFGAISVSRIDPATNQVVATLPDVGRPVIGDGVVWVAGPGGVGTNGAILQIDPATNRFVGRPFPLDVGPGYVAAGEGTVWIGKWYLFPVSAGYLGPAPGTFEYRRYDPTTNELTGPSLALNGPTSVVIGDGALWASLPGNDIGRASIGS